MQLAASSRIGVSLALALVACAPRSQPVRVQAPGLSLEATLEPPAPHAGENRLWLELRDDEGRPVEDARVEVRVHMPAMGAMPAMGGSARVEALGGGRYRADFALEMAGTWQVAVEARAPGGAALRAEGSLGVGTPGLRLESAGAAPPPGDTSTHAKTHPAEFQVAPERLQRIGVRTAPALVKELSREVRATGRVIFDESALADVSLRIGGTVRELRVSAVGDRVERGEVLFTLFSPELFAAQADLVQALRSQARARESGAPDRADAMVRAARNRLRLWGIEPAEIERVAERGEPLEALAIRSPASGYVIEKSVLAGGAVEPGTRLYRIAPLDRVWVEAQLFESELDFAREGQRVEIGVPHLPGRRFEGRVALVLPALAAETRTARLRIELANPELELRPDMWATVHLIAASRRALVVPQSAVLHAGPRNFVFLALGNGRFRPQEIQIGAQQGEDVEVLAGLEEGQPVVASGTFLIASESRLRAALEQW